MLLLQRHKQANSLGTLNFCLPQLMTAVAHPRALTKAIIHVHNKQFLQTQKRE